MTVISIMSEDQVRAKGTFDLLEVLLDVLAVVREETASKLLDDDSLPGHAVQERLRARARFAGSAAFRTEDDPPDGQVVMIPDQLEQRAAAANLDVVGMRAQAQ